MQEINQKFPVNLGGADSFSIKSFASRVAIISQKELVLGSELERIDYYVPNIDLLKTKINLSKSEYFDIYLKYTTEFYV